MAAEPQVVQDTFSLAIRRDRGKDQIGANAVWDLIDYIPDLLGAGLTKRGAWEKKGSWDPAAPEAINAGIRADIGGTRYLLAAARNGDVWRVTQAGNTWTIDGTTVDVGLLKQNPVYYWDKVFFPSPDGTQDMSVADASTVVAYTDTTTYIPQYLVPWKNRLVGATGPNIVFGPPGDPAQAWDDLAVYPQVENIVGLAVVSSITMVFYEGRTERIRGTTPAGYDVVEDDLIIDVLWPEVGCMDAFTICQYNDSIIWADKNGVYQTDGAAPIDLTERGGIKTYWREVMEPLASTYNAGNLRVACGMLGDLLHVTISNTNTMEVYKTFVCNVPTRQWWTYSNFPFFCYFPSPASPTGGGKELFAGGFAENQNVAEISHTLEPGNRQADENDVDILPVVEFPYHRFAPGNATIHDLYLGYAVSGAPLLGATAPFWLAEGGGDNDDILFTSTLAGVEGELGPFIYVFLINNGPLSDPGFVTVSVVDPSPGGTVQITIQVPTDGAGLPSGTAQDIIDLVAADADAPDWIVASVPPGNDGTGVYSTPLPASSSLSGGVAGTPNTQVLQVSWSGDMKPHGIEVESYGDGAEFLGEVDVHGDADDGYHWRRVPVRKTFPGLSVTVAQVNPTDDTRIYALGLHAAREPNWSQR